MIDVWWLGGRGLVDEGSASYATTLPVSWVGSVCAGWSGTPRPPVTVQQRSPPPVLALILPSHQVRQLGTNPPLSGEVGHSLLKGADVGDGGCNDLPPDP